MLLTIATLRRCCQRKQRQSSGGCPPEWTVPVPLTSEEEAALIAQAKAQGVSVDSLVRKAVLQIISSGSTLSIQPAFPLTAEEFDKAFDEIADLIPENVPPLSDAALTRESIYTREDDWNLNR